ncbi:hypothetical protein QQ045_004593 [Rhodiola kirilowii]
MTHEDREVIVIIEVLLKPALLLTVSYYIPNLMKVKVGILILLTLATACKCDAIKCVPRGIPAQLEKSEKVCTYCEQSVAQAVQYLLGNSTQQQIMAILHDSCSRLKLFADECFKVVDYYAPMFFFELSIVQPNDVCQKFNLCEIMEKDEEFLRSGFNNCYTCRGRVSETFYILKNRDTQLIYIEKVGFRCKSMLIYIQKCVPMAYEYVPQLIGDLERFLGAADICAAYFDCTAAENDNGETFSLEGEPLLSET